MAITTAPQLTRNQAGLMVTALEPVVTAGNKLAVRLVTVAHSDSPPLADTLARAFLHHRRRSWSRRRSGSGSGSRRRSRSRSRSRSGRRCWGLWYHRGAAACVAPMVWLMGAFRGEEGLAPEEMRPLALPDCSPLSDTLAWALAMGQ